MEETENASRLTITCPPVTSSTVTESLPPEPGTSKVERCLAVITTGRPIIAGGSLKSLDFIVSPTDDVSLLIDVKGRKFPTGTRHKQYWRNWSTWDDLASMARWQEKIGTGSCALLVFAYHVVGTRSPLAVRVAEYIHFARPLSARWQTVAMSTRLFRQAAFSLDRIIVPPENRLDLTCATTPGLVGELTTGN